MAKSDFWQRDQDEISRLNQQRANLKEILDQWQKHFLETEDAKILAEMASEEDDQSTLKEIEKDVFRLEKEVNDLEFKSLLGEPDDRRNVILAVNAGAGGTESQDWVEMLFRMYLRWCESNDFKTFGLNICAEDLVSAQYNRLLIINCLQESIPKSLNRGWICDKVSLLVDIRQ